MQSKFQVGVISLLMSFFSTLAVGQDKLRIYTENYPPYNMSNSGQPFAHKAEDISGLCTELVKAILKHSKVDFSLKLREWSAGLSRAQKRPNHAIFCTAKTDERKPYFHWVGPLAEIEWTLFAKPGSNIKLKKLEDAKQYRIGGYKGDVLSDYLIERGFNVVTIANDALNPRKLMLGQIDLWITDGLSGPYLASESEDIEDLAKVLVFKTTPLYLAVNIETDAKIVNELNNAYNLIKGNGEADAISAQYMQ
jgi:polar amino acid transport system substrate-binding protein